MKKSQIINLLLVILIMLFGCFLRLKGYIANPSMWHDECNLALSVFDYGLFDFFFKKLEYLQVAPPLFMFFTKVLTVFFGYGEHVFRFIPLAAGCASVVLFYFVSGYYLKTKTSRLLALFFFSINTLLIYYSNEFKQYSTDVFCSLLVIYLFNRFDISKLSYKKAIAAGVLYSVIIWMSFVSGIVVLAGYVSALITTKYYKKVSVSAVPVLILCLLCVKLFLFASYTGTTMARAWSEEFVSRNFSNLLYLFVMSLKYFFEPVRNLLFLTIFFIWGLVLALKKRESRFYILYLTIIMLVIFSWLRLYPTRYLRVLFLFPVYAIILFKPFELFSINRKFVSLLLLFMIILTFTPQVLLTGKYIKTKNHNKRDPAREFSRYVYEKIKLEDKIFLNIASNTEFEYYKHFYPVKNKVLKESPVENLKDTRVSKVIEIIEKEKGDFWIYMPYDIPHRAVSAELSDYLYKNSKVYENWRFGDAVLMYVNVK